MPEDETTTSSEAPSESTPSTDGAPPQKTGTAKAAAKKTVKKAAAKKPARKAAKRPSKKAAPTAMPATPAPMI